ncbi:hypothetical protein FOTG_13852 [Fusarium oxysporum f. sp. vasinfectum 25433]|nr:hypothetical protein FOTG_13852 [Fusarium oxysporum f. sp. vasinfectum 25433]
MMGPEGYVKKISELTDFDFSAAETRGFYWHLGVNDQMDHLDQIGVYIEQGTGDLMQEMYLNIANLITRLPVGG